MKNKILYIIGGIFGSFLLLGMITTPTNSTQQTISQVESGNFSQAVEETVPDQEISQQEEQQTEDNEQIQENDSYTKQPETKPTEVVVQQAQTEPVQKPVEQTSTENYYAVTSVVDGDTIKIDMDGVTETLRLIGIDTPETVDPRKPVQCFGKEASNKAKELLSGRKVRIEKDSTQGERDKYDRLLVYVYRDDGLFFNKYMIEQGYAHEYTYNIPYTYQTEFKNAQKLAQDNQRGLWSPDTCNGDTVSQTEQNQTIPVTTSSGGKFYTSSYYSSKYYYCESDDGWRSLSEKYLKVYNTESTLLAEFPNRTLHESCQ